MKPNTKTLRSLLVGVAALLIAVVLYSKATPENVRTIWNALGITLLVLIGWVIIKTTDSDVPIGFYVVGVILFLIWYSIPGVR